MHRAAFLRSEWRQCGTFLTSGLKLPTATIGSEHPIGAILDRLTHRVRIVKMNRESFRLRQSRKAQT